MNEMQEAARRLHALGFKTLPIKPGTKEPACAHGVKDATDDDAATDAYYATRPHHGIGVSGEGFVIFDFDVKPGLDGRDILTDWDLPDTLTQTTPSGGLHMIYRTSEDVRPSVNSEIAVDVRGWHSYIVCDPTPGYCFEDDCEIADADETVMRFLEAVRPKKRKMTPYRGKADGKRKLKDGEGRNDDLYRYGCSLQSDARPDDEVANLMHAYNQASFDPPLDEGELRKCVENVLTNIPKGHSEEVKQQQARRGRPRKFDHSAVGDALMEECGACFVDGMPAIRRGDVFAVGWNAVDAEIIARVKDATRANQNEVHHYLTVLAERKRQSPPNLIAFENGVLDVDTMELRDWLPDDVIPNIVPHMWNPGAECPAVDEILLKMSACEPAVYQNLMEVMGCCMYRSAEFGQSAILLGGGSNGKSTYIQMLLAMLGEQNVSSLDMGMIGKQFHTGRLVGKLANLGDDISNEFQHGDLLSIFKKVVTGNRLYADVKGTEGFEFTPYCQMVFSANEFPRLADYTDGMMRRIFPIEFNAVFRRTDPDYDPRISKKVTTEAACERMCVLAVAALRNVIAQNGFSPNAASQRRVEEIKADNDTVLAWAIDEYRDGENLDGCVIAECYERYRAWCMESGLQAVKRTKFTRSITGKYGLESKVVKRDFKTVRCFAKTKPKK